MLDVPFLEQCRSHAFFWITDALMHTSLKVHIIKSHQKFYTELVIASVDVLLFCVEITVT